jgi:hypothetical protein
MKLSMLYNHIGKCRSTTVAESDNFCSCISKVTPPLLFLFQTYYRIPMTSLFLTTLVYLFSSRMQATDEDEAVVQHKKDLTEKEKTRK